jgi:hypothetical protein
MTRVAPQSEECSKNTGKKLIKAITEKGTHGGTLVEQSETFCPMFNRLRYMRAAPIVLSLRRRKVSVVRNGHRRRFTLLVLG